MKLPEKSGTLSIRGIFDSAVRPGADIRIITEARRNKDIFFLLLINFPGTLVQKNKLRHLLQIAPCINVDKTSLLSLCLMLFDTKIVAVFI